MQPEATKDGNLGTVQQDRRLRMGAAGVAFGILLAIFLLKLGVPPAFRLVLIVPFFFGSATMYMGLYGT